MADFSEQRAGSQATERLLKRLSTLNGLPWIQVALLLIIWVAPLLIPERSGIKFGLGYQLLFTFMVLLGTLVFWLLGQPSLAQPKGTGRVVGIIVGVFLVTVTLLVVAGAVYPQFDLPEAPGAVAQEAAERGEGLFFSDNVGCFRCHTISGRGGTRGPDLTHVASRTGERVPGLSAEEYIRQSTCDPGAIVVEPYDNIMLPGFCDRLAEQEIDDLVAFLLTLE
ncbi:MAG: c-type cytochrome [Dehalococcoidia bacterium]